MPYPNNLLRGTKHTVSFKANTQSNQKRTDFDLSKMSREETIAMTQSIARRCQKRSVTVPSKPPVEMIGTSSGTARRTTMLNRSLLSRQVTTLTTAPKFDWEASYRQIIKNPEPITVSASGQASMTSDNILLFIYVYAYSFKNPQEIIDKFNPIIQYLDTHKNFSLTVDLSKTGQYLPTQTKQEMVDLHQKIATYAGSIGGFISILGTTLTDAFIKPCIQVFTKGLPKQERYNNVIGALTSKQLLNLLNKTSQIREFVQRDPTHSTEYAPTIPGNLKLSELKTILTLPDGSYPGTFQYEEPVDGGRSTTETTTFVYTKKHKSPDEMMINILLHPKDTKKTPQYTQMMIKIPHDKREELTSLASHVIQEVKLQR